MNSFVKDYYTEEEIVGSQGIPARVLAHLIATNRFPKSDKVEMDVPYWHRLTINQFMKVYEDIKSSLDVSSGDFYVQREDYISKAREFIKKHGIVSSFQYKELQASKGDYLAPSPTTLFCYSVTMEELIISDIVNDPVCIQILNNLRYKRTAEELSTLCGVPAQTIYRKLLKLCESGYVIGSENGYYLAINKIDNS